MSNPYNKRLLSKAGNMRTYVVTVKDTPEDMKAFQEWEIQQLEIEVAAITDKLCRDNPHLTISDMKITTL